VSTANAAVEVATMTGVQATIQLTP
jgi:hypothetical protein